MRICLIFITAILLISCADHRLYEYHHDFDDRHWNTGDTAIFSFEIPATEKPCPVYLQVRNSLDYPFARLFVKYRLFDSAGHVLDDQLLTHYLFDQKTGKPFGESSLGDVYDHRFTISKGYAFPYAGKYSIKLEQFMRLDTLPGISAVGIRIENQPPQP